MKKKSIIAASTALVLIFVALFVYLSLTKVSQAKDTVVFNNTDYYPSYLPYVSEDVLSLPIDTPNGTIDPTNYSDLKATGFHNEYLPLNSRLYMVQYKTGRTLENYMDTRPARVLSINTYVLSLNSDELKSLTENPDINFVANYHPHYKMHSDVVSSFYNLEITPETELTMTFTPFTPPTEIQYILKSQSIKSNYTDDIGQHYVVQGIADRQEMFGYASNPQVTEIKFAD